MPKLGSRERLSRVFKCEPVDRLPIRLWGVDPMFRSADATWEPLYQMIEQHDLDIVRNWSPAASDYPPAEGPSTSSSTTRESTKPGMNEVETVIQTPAGPLTTVYYQPQSGAPGYVKKHMIETVEDAKRWLSIPRNGPPPGTDSYWELERKTGDSAMIMVGIGEAMYGVQAQMGSETFGYWLRDERELLREMIDTLQAEVEKIVKHYLAAGIGDSYGWVGPELCIPPLASPQDFNDFVTPYDGKIIDLIHDAGKLAWIHCHGDMDPVLERFVDMNLDCLNPIEPPPVGKLTLAEAKERVAGRMCLEGGIEDGDFDLLSPRQIAEKTEQVVAEGKPGGGFILSPSSAPSTWVHQSDRHIANYRAFIETAVRTADYD